MKSKFTLQLLLPLSALLSTGTFAQSNSALSFDGLASTVNMNADLIPSSGNGSFTVECWVFVPTIEPGPHFFLSEGQPLSAMALGYDGDCGGCLVAGDFWWPGLGDPTAIYLPVNQWAHIALTANLDDNDPVNGHTAKLYVNGVLRGSMPADPGDMEAARYYFSDGASNFQLGSYPDGTSLMNGSMDEVKVWGAERTAAQIKRDMLGIPDPSAPGLVAYYNMNEGSGPTVSNSCTNTLNIDGVLTSTAWTPSPVQSGNNALSFSGTDNLVVIPANPAYDLSGPSTIEFCVKTTGTLAGDATILANQDSITGDLRYRIHMTQTAIGLESNGTDASVPFSFTPDQWYHVAFASNGTNTTIYVDGAAISSPSNPISQNFSGPVTGQPITLGMTRVAAANTNILTGGLDELRFWNTQRAGADINANKSNTLTGMETNLVGLFSFNQGTDDHDNTGLITVPDNTVATNNATLLNFNLSDGSASNFGVHTLTIVPLPVNLTQFTAGKLDRTAVLQWQTAQEENSRDFTIERSTNGENYTPIGTVAAAGNSQTKQDYEFTDDAPQKGNNYYRLKQSDIDGNFKYSSVKVLSFSAPNQLTWYTTGKGTAEVDFKGGNNELYSVNDATGNLIRKGRLSSGKTTLSGVASGMYVVKVVMATGFELNTQVIIR